MRPKFVADGKEFLFINFDGHPFQPSTIGRRVTKLLHQAGIRKDIRATATNICKMISDKASKLSPTKKRLIHGHMKHQERIADANYVIQLNADHASMDHQLVQNIIQETGDSQQHDQPLSTKLSEKNMTMIMTCPWARFLEIPPILNQTVNRDLFPVCKTNTSQYHQYLRRWPCQENS